MPRGRWWTSTLLTALVSLPAPGCSFFFSHAPPDNHEQLESFSCTESNLAPILDATWAGLMAASAIAVTVNPDAYENRDEGVPGMLVWTLLSGYAASRGFRKSSECRVARRHLAERRQLGPMHPGAPPVDAYSVRTVSVTPGSDTLRVGERVQLIANGLSAIGAIVPHQAFTWSSSNSTVATVSADGYVTARSAGTAQVIARTAGVSGTAAIVVLPAR